MSEFYIEKKDPVRKAERAQKRNLKKFAEADKTGHKIEGHSENKGAVLSESEFLEKTEAQQTNLSSRKDTLFHGPGKVQTNKIKTSRTAIPQSTLHQVHLRDRRKCKFVIDGHGPCASQQWLEIHHKLPLSQGGDHSLDNLTTLCR